MSDLDSILDQLADKIAAKLSDLAPAAKALPPGNKLSTLELASRLGVHEETCRRWVKQGCPAETLPGGRKRFDLTAVTLWLKSRRAA
jgi:excisionase family DNA binding protein